MKSLFPAAALIALAGCGDPSATPSEGRGDPSATPSQPTADAPVILAFGDSLYAGYGLAPGESYPARLEAALAARGIPARLVNAGVSGDTTAAGRKRLAFALDNQPRPPALVLVGLGGNDMLRGLPPREARANLAAMLDELKRRGIPAMLAGMLAAPNMGADYAREFNAIFPDLAKQYNVPLVPFFLAPAIGKAGMMQADRVHPTAAGIDAIVAATVDEVASALPRKPD